MAPSHPNRPPAAWLLLAALFLTACVHSGGNTQPGPGGTGAQSNDPHALLKGPGVEFSRVDKGVPAQTLDYVGTAASALAGAKASGDVFFGNSDKGDLQVYRRNLERNERTYITELKPYHEGSLASTPDGHWLVYCRFRPLKEVIDDPKLAYPDNIAVSYTFDVEKKEEHRLFDYGQPEFRKWRANGVQPTISPNGRNCYVLAYDMDRLLLHKQTEEWLLRDKHLQSKDPKQSASDRKSEQELIESFITSAGTRQLLKDAGVTVNDAKPITSEVRAAMEKYNKDTVEPKSALLISEDSKPRILPFEPEAQYKDYFHFLAAVGDHTVVVGAQQLGGEVFAAEPLYKLDTQTGQLHLLDTFTGLSKLVTLDKAEQNLLICYNPVDTAKKVIVASTHLRRIPLDGGAAVETDLGHDYLGSVLDLDAASQHMAAQDNVDHSLYFVDVAKGERQLVAELIDPLTGLFITGDGKRIVCLDKGVSYSYDVSGDFTRRKDWVDDGHFAPYRTAVENFLQQAGFSVAAGPKWHWEERDGFGTHEASVQIADPAKPEQAVLVRYNVTDKRVTAFWLPGGYLFPIASELQGSNFDYYDAERLAKKVLDRVGWIPEPDRKLYQPGPNPLYDKKSDSYVVTFRRPYTLRGAGAQQAFNQEATLRIGAKSGQLIEMTLSALPEIQDQPLTIQRKDLNFIARNYKKQPFAETAPITVDAQGARLIVYPHPKQDATGAVYKGTIDYRLCWEVDLVSPEEHDLYFTYLVDTETGDILGDLSYAPVAPVATKVDR
jgi:hypothetical protein